MQTPTIAPENAPPIPTLGQASSGTLPISDTESNAWQHLVSSVSVHAETSRYTARYGGTASVRSTFRLGEMRLDETGIVLDGVETKPIIWLKNLGMVCGILFYLSANLLRPALRALTVSSKGLWMLIPVGIGILGWAATIINERRRGPSTVAIPWSSVRELHTDPKFRWTTFIYEMPPEKPKGKPVTYALSLNKLEPSTIGGIVSTVAHLAPKVTRRDRTVHQWSRAGIITISLAVAMTIAAVAFVFWKRYGNP